MGNELQGCCTSREKALENGKNILQKGKDRVVGATAPTLNPYTTKGRSTVEQETWNLETVEEIHKYLNFIKMT